MVKALTPRLRLFFGIGAFLLVINLFIMNDVATLWDGAETQFTWTVLYGKENAGLPVWGARLLSGRALAPFAIRLSGGLLFLAVLVAAFYVALPVLGGGTALWMLLVLGSSFLLPNTAKLATADSWSFAFHLLGVLFLLRFLKKPAPPWRWAFYLTLLAGIWIAPLSSLLLYSIMPALLYWLHPLGARMWRLQPWGALLIIGGVLFVMGMLDGSSGFFYFGFQPGRFLLFNFLGMLPFLGFLVAGLADMAGKAKRGGEMALISVSWVAAAWLSHSLVLQAAFALLVARQLHLYFQENYPFRDLVRAVAVFHLVLVFCAATLLMMGGFARFEGAGFRAGLAVSTPYWMAGFVSVIGLFGMNRRFVWGGTVMGGLLATLLFWVQLYPLWEQGRRLPQQLALEAAGLRESSATPLYLWAPGTDRRSNEFLYARQYFSEVNAIADTAAVDSLYREVGAGVFAVPREAAPPASELRDTVILRGLDDRFRRVEWVLFR
jgi:hypothetical protein